MITIGALRSPDILVFLNANNHPRGDEIKTKFANFI